MREFKSLLWLLVSLFSTLFAALFTLFMATMVFIVAHLGRRKWDDRVVRAWGQVLVWSAGLHVEVRGLENLPSRGVVLVFNHSSLYDILIAHACIPMSFRFGAKAELFRIPVFGRAMRIAGALKIERKNLSAVIQEYAVAKERIKNGESFILAPEGTRVSTGEIGPFKAGPFLLAINAQAPLLPIVLTGVHRVIPKTGYLINWNWSRRVALDILPVIETQGLSADERDQLRDRVRDAMVRVHSQRRSALQV